jgi:hypothetical protein
MALSRTAPREFEPQKILLATLAPVVGIGGVAAFTTATSASIVFSTQSQIITSGNYGPNQVSAMLGLGALFALVSALTTSDRRLRVILLVVVLLMTAQATLTFSRGGLVSLVAAALVFAAHFLRSARLRWAVLVSVTTTVIVFSTLLVPWLNEFSRGALEARFTSFDVTSRDVIARGDIQLWMENPILGVGVGQSPGLRSVERGQLAHTEFTRLLAEHGLLGALGIVCLILIIVGSYRMAPGLTTKAWVAMAATWAILTMGHAATRLAAIPFVFALGALRWPSTSIAPRAGARDLPKNP